MYKLIAFDVDGTLIDSRGVIPEEVRLAVRKAKQAGIAVTVISGRTISSLANVLAELEIDPPYAGSNGAFVAYRNAQGLLFHRPLPERETKMIVGVIREYQGVGISFHTAMHGYFDDEGYRWIIRNAPSWVPLARHVPLEDILQQIPTPCKIELMGEPETILSLAGRIRAGWPELVLASGLNGHCLEINAAGIDKGNALEYIAHAMQIPLSEVVAAGDGQNDIGMLKKAGLSVAMANAHPDLMPIVDIVAPSNDEAGVAWLLEEVILKRVRLVTL